MANYSFLTRFFMCNAIFLCAYTKIFNGLGRFKATATILRASLELQSNTSPFLSSEKQMQGCDALVSKCKA